MKKLYTYGLAAIASFLVTAPANAAVVDFDGAHVDMGAVDYGQTGTITNIYQELFTLPPQVVGGGSAYGFLPSNARITFTYTFDGLDDGALRSYGAYDFISGGDRFQGNAVEQTPTVDAGGGFSSSSATINGAASSPLIFATADLSVLPSGTSVGTTSITNLSSSFASYESLFTGLLRQVPPGVGKAVYAVSVVPLPAALPMFLSLLAGFLGYGRYSRKKRALMPVM